MKTAFVLGGGGVLGAHEVGMLRALAEAGIKPDVVVGTSVGAINGAFVAADPAGAAERLGELWHGARPAAARSAGTCSAGRPGWPDPGTHLHAIEPLRAMLEQALPAADFADLELPLPLRRGQHRAGQRALVQQRAAGARRARLVRRARAAAAGRGGRRALLRRRAGALDPGGPGRRAGRRTIYVLHVGRIESPLVPPRRLWEVGLVAFEIARRHRFHEEMAALPDDVRVHVLPSGGTQRAGRGHVAAAVPGQD